MYKTIYNSPVGQMTLVENTNKLSAVLIKEQKYFYTTVSEKPIENNNLPLFNTVKKWFDKYFAGEKPSPFDLPLAPIGGQFRQLIWKYLLEIPYGETTTYGAIAKKAAAKLHKKMSAQAVGGAVGHNPISIIIPCHRVVGTNGSLTGYASGLDVKIKLLKLEGVDMTKFFVPKKGTAL